MDILDMQQVGRLTYTQAAVHVEGRRYLSLSGLVLAQAATVTHPGRPQDTRSYSPRLSACRRLPGTRPRSWAPLDERDARVVSQQSTLPAAAAYLLVGPSWQASRVCSQLELGTRRLLVFVVVVFLLRQRLKPDQVNKQLKPTQSFSRFPS